MERETGAGARREEPDMLRYTSPKDNLLGGGVFILVVLDLDGAIIESLIAL